MIDSTVRITDVNSSRTGGSTIILEVCGERDDCWIITTTDSPDETDYGCLYSDDQHPMSRTEELLLLNILEAFVVSADNGRELNDICFIINLIKSKNQ